MPLDITLRQVERQDLEQVVSMLQSISHYVPEPGSSDATWQQISAQGNVLSVVATLDQLIVGYGSIVIETKIRGGKMGHIEDIVAHLDYRGEGIGKLLLETLAKIAESHGCYKIALQCGEHNVDFYAKCGFQLAGQSMQKFL